MNTFATYASHQFIFLPLAKRCYLTNKGVKIKVLYAAALVAYVALFYLLFCYRLACRFGTRSGSTAIRNYPQFAKAAQYQLFAKHLIRSARSAELNCNYFLALQLCLFWFCCPHPGNEQRPGCRSALEHGQTSQTKMFSLFRQKSRMANMQRLDSSGKSY